MPGKQWCYIEKKGGIDFVFIYKWRVFNQEQHGIKITVKRKINIQCFVNVSNNTGPDVLSCVNLFLGIIIIVLLNHMHLWEDLAKSGKWD